MENRIPLPTDNLYKFAALFSLLLVASGFALVVYATKATNSVVFEHWVELETLRSEAKLSLPQEARKASLERVVEVASSDKQTYITLAVIMATLGALGVVSGFMHWYRCIQPVADQMAATQLELAKLQLLALRADLRARGVDLDEGLPAPVGGKVDKA
ncbi:hypothetical protein NAV33_20425 [Pseudomonas stutzeri]|uniref:hypothetical protein n=1 Tax=Stutzerimonas stutzeri TaxID=316 RepID=UPI0021099375|nr:hypothetical protein [Stutzerimonas stutzeri]MCQ4314237.1 hypothetical protein [Stutzerimonas stutzeri]